MAVLVVGGGLLPAEASPERCDTRQVETLTIRVGDAPVRLRPGQQVPVTFTVVRGSGSAAESGAAGVEVGVSLTGTAGGTRWGAYGDLVSEADGSGATSLVVPRGVSGSATLDVEVFRDLIALPCLQVEEHGHLTQAWGRVS